MSIGYRTFELLKADYELRMRDTIRSAVADYDISQKDIEDELRKVSRRDRPLLQTFFSYHEKEWNLLEEAVDMQVDAFLHFLENMNYPLTMRYNPVDLNLDYYIEKMRCEPRNERVFVQKEFIKRWGDLLHYKEYCYQTECIDRMCERYVQNIQTLISQLGMPIIGEWDSSQINELRELYDLSLKDPIIKEIVSYLGKDKQSQNESCISVTKKITRIQYKTATKSEITGITIGNDIRHVLSVELNYMKDPLLNSLFYNRFMEKKLLQVDSRSVSPEKCEEKGKVKEKTSEGAFILCMDTSGSMSIYSQWVKSISYAIIRIANRMKRTCAIINFSDSALHIGEGSDYKVIRDLISLTIDGGTDLRPCMKAALKLKSTPLYEKADVIILSDFEMEDLAPSIIRKINDSKEKQSTGFYGACFGNDCNESYFLWMDKVWCFEQERDDYQLK